MRAKTKYYGLVESGVACELAWTLACDQETLANEDGPDLGVRPKARNFSRNVPAIPAPVAFPGAPVPPRRGRGSRRGAAQSASTSSATSTAPARLVPPKDAGDASPPSA